MHRPMFERRHYRAIAREFAISRSYIAPERIAARHEHDDMVTDLAAMLARDNPRFNLAAFLVAAKTAPEDEHGPYRD